MAQFRTASERDRAFYAYNRDRNRLLRHWKNQYRIARKWGELGEIPRDIMQARCAYFLRQALKAYDFNLCADPLPAKWDTE